MCRGVFLARPERVERMGGSIGRSRAGPLAPRKMSATFDETYNAQALHADVDAGKVSGFYGGSYISFQVTATPFTLSDLLDRAIAPPMCPF